MWSFLANDVLLRDCPCSFMTMETLEGLTNQVAAQLCLGAKLIYWHHDTDQFTYLLGRDKDMWRREWRNLKYLVASGLITSVTSAGPIVVQATGEESHRSMRTPLYPMLVVLMGLDNQVIQCPAYFILNQSGDSENMNRTPYFYTSKAARDYAVDKLSSLIHTHQRDTGG
jgi:hypothetical protein